MEAFSSRGIFLCTLFWGFDFYGRRFSREWGAIILPLGNFGSAVERSILYTQVRGSSSTFRLFVCFLYGY